MHKYAAEIKAGINFAENSEGSSCATVTSSVKNGDFGSDVSVADLMQQVSMPETLEQLIGNDQPDLAFIVAILVSTGWNLNDDVFLPEEVWAARNTPTNKPLNDNHNEEKILGHIVQSRAINKDGDNVDGDRIPSEFDIEVAGVLYKSFPKLKERIEEIISKANTGEMFVSMEVWFPDFSYAIIDPKDNTTKIVERNEQTAFLTKHLRRHGGTGEYEGYRIGRVFRNMTFGAQGFVTQPANPKSVIKMATSNVFETAELDDFVEGGVDKVDEKTKELQLQLEESKAKTKEKETEIATMLDKVDGLEKQVADLGIKVDELTGVAAETQTKLNETEAEKVELQKAVSEMTEKAESSETELAEIRATELARARLEKLSAIKSIQDAEGTLKELKGMSDETFDLVLKYAGEHKSEKTESVEGKEDAGDDAVASLENVEEVDTPDLKASVSLEESESDLWSSMANEMCGLTDENEGGE